MAETQTTTEPTPLSSDDLRLLDAYWRAANYLSVAQIYLLDNPLLREPLQPEHVKPRLLGHFGTVPGLNLLYAHLNRQIRARDLSAIYITGPGHGGPALVANAYLEGTYSELYPNVGRDEAGLRQLFRQFSFPGGIPSHVAPGGAGLDPRGRRARLRARARLRRRFRQPRPAGRLRRRRRRGRDRPAGGELALEQVPEPEDRRRRAAGPAPERLQDRQPDRARAHPRAASSSRSSRATAGGRSSSPAASTARTRRTSTSGSRRPSTRRSTRSARSSARAREAATSARPTWPMLILRTPKGWTGPKEVDGKKTEDSWRSHQVPMAAVRDSAAHMRQLEEWLRSYRPEELFDDEGRLVPELARARAARASGG